MTDKGKLWEARLQDTLLFPEGGGQPWDTGTVGGVPVSQEFKKWGLGSTGDKNQITPPG